MQNITQKVSLIHCLFIKNFDYKNDPQHLSGFPGMLPLNYCLKNM